METGLRDGGIGIGVNSGYAPGYGRKQYYALAQHAARHEVPTFIHVRYLSGIELLSDFEALEELAQFSVKVMRLPGSVLGENQYSLV